MKPHPILICLCILCALCISYVIHAPESIPTSNFVSWGTSGDLVARTQQRLADLGYYRGSVDGVFGSRTYEAILEFQEDNGLQADGIAGTATLLALGITNANNPYEDDTYLLASIIHGEARGEPYEGQVAVGAVVLNRVESQLFPDSIAEVIYQQGAFDAVRDNQIYLTPNESALNAARDALNGVDPVDGALYYWNPVTATSRWIWQIPISEQIGRHVFGGAQG